MNANKTNQCVVEEVGLSKCPCCENTYIEAQIQSEEVVPCIRCYKCFVGDCGNTSCDCEFTDDEEEEGEEGECECCDSGLPAIKVQGIFVCKKCNNFECGLCGKENKRCNIDWNEECGMCVCDCCDDDDDDDEEEEEEEEGDEMLCNVCNTVQPICKFLEGDKIEQPCKSCGFYVEDGEDCAEEEEDCRTKPCSCGCGVLGGSCDRGVAIDNGEEDSE